MDSSKMMIVAGTWVLMMIWLAFVAVSGVSAFRKWKRTNGAIRTQMLYLWVGAAIVFTGDFLHTVSATVSTYTDNATGPINIMGSIFEFRTFAMFFDALVFIIYYALWALFIAARYQQGTLKSYDRTSITLATLAMLLILPGAVPNAFGVYTLDYDIAIWAPHIFLFIIFGLMTVSKLIRCSGDALTRTSDPLVQTQEKALSRAGTGFAFSFLFFFLSLALIPVNELFGMFMIPKTFAYMYAFYHLIKGVILPTPEVRAGLS